MGARIPEFSGTWGGVMQKSPRRISASRVAFGHVFLIDATLVAHEPFNLNENSVPDELRFEIGKTEAASILMQLR
jgi:hypothetical protein